MNRTNLAIKDEYAVDTEIDVDSQEIEIKELQEKKIKEPNYEKVQEKKKVGIVYLVCKKVVDIIAGVIGTILLVPITLIVWLVRIFKRENDGPLFYEQLRIGKNGKQFRIYKFRTMVMNVDEKLYEYLDENEEARKEYKKYKKLKNDPRITKLGAFLRKTSLDEFPQFINILKGDMSLVGPRPYLHREKDDMGDYYEQIIQVKPGITGYWQVNGRNDVDFEERTYMDTYYIEHRGIIMDIKIMLKTVLKIFKKEGAI